jgi:hypothetical protein
LFEIGVGENPAPLIVVSLAGAPMMVIFAGGFVHAAFLSSTSL